MPGVVLRLEVRETRPGPDRDRMEVRLPRLRVERESPARRVADLPGERRLGALPAAAHPGVRLSRTHARRAGERTGERECQCQ